jgi:hypothetical protein
MRRPAINSAQIEGAYKFLSYQTLNVIIALLAVNLVLACVFFARDRMKAFSAAPDERVKSYRERFADHEAYTKLSRAEIDTFLDDQDSFNSVGFQYAPWVEFRHPSYNSRHLNTDERGFRLTRPPRASSDKPQKIHLFGGSTTFGFGVPDEHTIASYLQSHMERSDPTLSVLVKNFGQGFYYSSQELQIFMTLLKDGDIPDWAVFIDGGNDNAQLASRHDEPIFTPTLTRLWKERNGTTAKSDHELPRWIPMVRLAESVTKYLGAAVSSAPAADQHQTIRDDSNLSQKEKDEIFAFIIDRYTNNMRIRRAICREFGVRCLFVWQPHPAYKYDRKLHKTFPFPGEIPAHHTRVWAYMEKLQAPDYLFLGDMTENASNKVYVDDVHYNEETNERIAIKIGEAINTR